MNSFVITVGGTTFNFKVAVGTTISIQMNNDDSATIENVVDLKNIVDLENAVDLENNSRSNSNSDMENAYDNQSIISNITDVIGTDSEIEILDTIKNVTTRTKRSQKNDDMEFCRPVKHSYEKDAEGNYMCPYCDAKKRKVNTLSEHVRANHSTSYGRNEETHNCVDCGKGFSSKSRLDNHVKNNHAISYEKCPHPGCEYNSAKNASTIIQHYVRHHMDYKTLYHMSEDNCVCNECGASSKSGIMYHLGICDKSSPFCKSK
jgi:hypothetical protein